MMVKGKFCHEVRLLLVTLKRNIKGSGPRGSVGEDPELISKSFSSLWLEPARVTREKDKNYFQMFDGLLSGARFCYNHDNRSSLRR